MILAIIPARHASTRFPGKPLADIDGKTMIRRVYEQVRKAKRIARVVVATDDERIADHVKEFGGEVVMTSAHHSSGTDRCYEAALLMDMAFEYVINVQGDEPFIQPGQIDALAGALTDKSIELATLVRKVNDEEILTNPNEVKVVLNTNMQAMYFSRQAIPHLRSGKEGSWHSAHGYYHHIGLYAYRIDILDKITKLPLSPLEKAESLEQLRWLENGFKITCVITEEQSYSIDIPGDIDRVLRIIAKK